MERNKTTNNMKEIKTFIRPKKVKAGGYGR